MNKDEIENVGHALSTVIQTRYVWLSSHIFRSYFFHIIDHNEYETQKFYSFSEEDQRNGVQPIDLQNIIELIKKNDEGYAYSEDGKNTCDYKYIRDITLSGLRGSFLVSTQSYLEYFRILDICKKYNLKEKDLFDFIRQARNIICHSNSDMNSPGLKRCQWRHLIIENNGQKLKITDHLLHELVNDAIEFLASLYIANGKEIDYVSLNLGYTIPFIKKYIIDNKK